MNKLLLIASAALLSFSSCSVVGTKGSGHVISKTFNESGFKDIEVSSVMKVYLKQGNDFSVKIDAEDNILDLIKVEKEGSKLSVDFKNNISVSPTKDVIIYITAPEFHNLDASGAGGFISEGTLSGNEILLELSGATKAKLNVAVNTIKIDASGASKIILAGTTDQLSLDGSGSTKMEAIDLKAQDVDLDISGAGNATVYAEKKLDVSISGAGKVQYKGTPAISKDITGAGSISAY